jgi:O-antigen/teichoic acid export membrane protein
MTIANHFNAAKLSGTKLLDQAQQRFGASTVRGLIGFADQAVVSGSRFAATILIGRLCGAEQLGCYGLGFTFIVLLACIQEALITLPYTALAHHRRGGEAESYAGSVLVHSLALSVLAGIILSIWALYQSSVPGWLTQASVFGAVAVFLPALLLWEFARRIGFAQQRVAAVFWLDLATGCCWLATMAALALLGQLSPVVAFVAMGGTHAAVTLLWLCLYGQRFQVSVVAAIQEARPHWRFGRWILGSETLLMARGNIVPWLVAIFLGAADTGLFIAYLTIVILGNPILNGISNVLAPDLARAFAVEGATEVRRIVSKATLVLGVVMAGFSLLLAAIGEPLITFLYGAEFAGQQLCVIILAVGLLAEALGMASYNGLWAMHRPHLCFVACLLGLVATIGSTLVCIPTFGLAGAAIGFTAGKIVAAVVQGFAFRHLMRDCEAQGAAA